MVTQDLLAKDQNYDVSFDFAKDVFQQPTGSQEKILQ